MGRYIRARQYISRPHKRGNPENHIVLQIIKTLRAYGYNAYKVKTQGSPKVGGGFVLDPYRLTGWGDVLAWKTKEQLFMFEVKDIGNKQTPNQVFFESFFHFPPNRIYAVVHSIEETLQIVNNS
jgi:hypothetical protein